MSSPERKQKKERTTDFDFCLVWAISNGYPLGFLEKLAEKTTDFEDCLLEAIRDDLHLEFLEKLFEKTENFYGCLGSAIYGNLSPEFLEKLLEKSTEIEGCLLEAITQKFPAEFLDRLLEKGGRVKGNIPVPQGYEKYFPIFVENKECFICLLDFEEEQQQEKFSLPCGHSVHTGFNLQTFKCPYH